MHRFEADQIAIIGPGLLGGSIGLALRQSGYRGRLVGFARRATTAEQAVKRGCIDTAAPSLVEAVRGSDFVILCTPVSVILQQLADIAPVVGDRTVITDVGSTKRSIVAIAEQHLREPGQFVGSHPMAGGSDTGPEAARANLFDHKPCIVTPTGITDPEAVRRVERFWLQLGMHVHRMSVNQHDDAVARISHLPHALAFVLVDLAHRYGGLEVASTGFSQTTRIAKGDPKLWTDIFLDNRDHLLRNLTAWSQGIEEFRRLVASGDRQTLQSFIAAAQSARVAWPEPENNGNGKLPEPT
jgi:prephenate dehydrogenase